MIRIFEDGSTKEYNFKITKIPRKDRVDDDKYIARSVDYPTVIGTGRTSVKALMEAKDNLDVYIDYMTEKGKIRECLVETKTTDGQVVKCWHDMSKTTVGDMIKRTKEAQEKGNVVNIVAFGRWY